MWLGRIFKINFMVPAGNFVIDIKALVIRTQGHSVRIAK